MDAHMVVGVLRAGGTVAIDKPTIPDVFPIIEAYYAIPCHGLGGICHLWMEDSNPEQSTAESMLAYALGPRGEHDMQNDYDVFIAWLATQLSPTQRSKCGKQATYGIYADGAHAGSEPFWRAANTFMRDRLVSATSP